MLQSISVFVARKWWSAEMERRGSCYSVALSSLIQHRQKTTELAEPQRQAAEDDAIERRNQNEPDWWWWTVDKGLIKFSHTSTCTFGTCLFSSIVAYSIECHFPLPCGLIPWWRGVGSNEWVVSASCSHKILFTEKHSSSCHNQSCCIWVGQWEAVSVVFLFIDLLINCTQH